MNANVKGERTVQRITACGVSKIIGVIIFISMSFTIQRPCFFTKADKSLSLLKLFIGRYLLTVPARTKAVVFVDNLIVKGIKTEAHRSFGYCQHKCRCFDYYIISLIEYRH